MSSSAFFIEAAANTVRSAPARAQAWRGARQQAGREWCVSAWRFSSGAMAPKPGIGGMDRPVGIAVPDDRRRTHGALLVGNLFSKSGAACHRACGRINSPAMEQAAIAQHLERSTLTGDAGEHDGRGDAARRRIRLHHRRRGLGRLRAGEPAVGRSEQSRAAARSRRPRQLDLVPHPGRLSVRHRQSALGLDVQDRAGAGPQRPRAELSARQGDRRLVRRSTP